jgi:hypothetical protein
MPVILVVSGGRDWAQFKASPGKKLARAGRVAQW